MLRDGIYVALDVAVRHRSLWRAAAALHSAPGRPADGYRYRDGPPGTDSAPRVRSDDRAEMGDGVWRVRVDGRLLRQLRDAAGYRQDRAGRRVCSRMSAAA